MCCPSVRISYCLAMAIPERQITALFTSIQTLTRVLKGAEALGLAEATEQLSPSDVLALMHVGANPGSIQHELAEALAISPTTASSIVDRLVKKGLVLRTRTESNRRIVELNLTTKGAALHAHATDEQMRHCQLMLKALSPIQREQFISLMQTIAISLEAEGHRRRP
jgi:DNA-binding MarR family transcriptional regulator